jgi:hypothetical protein
MLNVTAGVLFGVVSKVVFVSKINDTPRYDVKLTWFRDDRCISKCQEFFFLNKIVYFFRYSSVRLFCDTN